MTHEQRFGGYTLKELANLAENGLAGPWHQGNGILSSGTVRVARADFDSNPAGETQKAILEQLAASAEALPALLKEISRLQDQQQELEYKIEQLQDAASIGHAQGFDAARAGVHELFLSEDGDNGINEQLQSEFSAIPFCRFRPYSDAGDSTSGMPARNYWALAPDQSGTVLGKLSASFEDSRPRANAAENAALDFVFENRTYQGHDGQTREVRMRYVETGLTTGFGTVEWFASEHPDIKLKPYMEQLGIHALCDLIYDLRIVFFNDLGRGITSAMSL